MSWDEGYAECCHLKMLFFFKTVNKIRGMKKIHLLIIIAAGIKNAEPSSVFGPSDGGEITDKKFELKTFIPDEFCSGQRTFFLILSQSSIIKQDRLMNASSGNWGIESSSFFLSSSFFGGWIGTELKFDSFRFVSFVSFRETKFTFAA